MDSSINLSVIIPIYNVEKYIEQCILSVINQCENTLKYEIIIVDDGSPDNSFNIACSLKKMYADTDIKIVQQENKGLGGARNTGLLYAKGDFVWFIDSDDWIHKNAFHKIETLIKDTSLDGIRISSADVVEERPINHFPYTNLDGTIVEGYNILNSEIWSPCVQFTIYNRSFLIKNKLKQQEHLFHEDSEFSPRAYYFAKRIYILNEVLYFTRMNPNSITRSINFKKNFDCIRVAASLDTFNMEFVKKEHKRKYYNIISTVLNSALLNTDIMDFDTRQKLTDIFFKNKSLFYNFIQSSVLKYKIEGILFVLFSRNVIRVYSILNKFYKRCI